MPQLVVITGTLIRHILAIGWAVTRTLWPSMASDVAFLAAVCWGFCFTTLCAEHMGSFQVEHLTSPQQLETSVSFRLHTTSCCCKARQEFLAAAAAHASVPAARVTCIHTLCVLCVLSLLCYSGFLRQAACFRQPWAPVRQPGLLQLLGASCWAGPRCVQRGLVSVCTG